MSIEVLQLANYVRPQVKESPSKDYVLNGDKNSFYRYIIDRYNGSPTNRAIIDSYAQFIFGKGLMSKQQSIKPITFAQIMSILSKEDLRRVCQDYALFGEASMELIFKSGKLHKIVHVPKNQIAPEKMNEDGDIVAYWWCQDFADINKYKPMRLDAFGYAEPSTGSQIYVITSYQAGKTYYSDPSYMAGLPYAELEEEIANYSINHIKNGLSAGFIINMNNGQPESEDVKETIREDIQEKLSGSSNAGAFILSFNENKENAATIEVVPVSDAHQQYEVLNKEAAQKLMIAHRVTSPILFGIKDNTGFGNNAGEMEAAFDELMTNVIQPKKEIILDCLMYIFTKCGFPIDLDFIPFRKPAENSNEVKMSAENSDSDPYIANLLIELGEEIEADYEIIDEQPYSESQTITETQLNLTAAVELARVPSSFPNASSEQDNPLFKIRYTYAGNQKPQREFCRKMMNAGKVYRKEDIELAGDKVVNAGFGPFGADTYNIWLYKGGPNCKHFWQRKIYMRRDNRNISVNKAIRIINELEPSERAEVRLPVNEPEVAKIPYDLPNNGYLTR